MTSRWTIAAAASAALLAGSSAAEAACSLKTVDIPVRMAGLRPLVTARINGQPVSLLVDSGSFYNALDSRFAAQQKLQPARTLATGTHFAPAAQGLTSGAGGTQRASQLVVAPSFEFAGAAFKDIPFFTFDLGDAAGVLGQNFLHQVDVEYHLGAGMMRLVQPQDCKTADLAYWAKPGMTYSAMALEPPERINTHNVGTILINGAKMRAWFDTGATATYITLRAAERAGVRTTDPGARAIGLSRGVDRADIKTWVAPFASVKIGDEEIKNTQLQIGDSGVVDFDILVGADFFLSHHVYVANSQDKLYFTYSGGQVFNVGAAPAASADR
jgi:predicted aspartyl protease